MTILTTVRKLATISLAVIVVSPALAFVALASAVSVCRAESMPLLTRHTREVTLNGKAALVGHLPENRTIRIVLVLPLREQAGLQSFLKAAYDPASSTHHKFLSVDQFSEKYGPAAADYDTVASVVRDAQVRGEADWRVGDGFVLTLHAAQLVGEAEIAFLQLGSRHLGRIDRIAEAAGQQQAQQNRAGSLHDLAACFGGKRGTNSLTHASMVRGPMYL